MVIHFSLLFDLIYFCGVKNETILHALQWPVLTQDMYEPFMTLKLFYLFMIVILEE